jgi:hypothetical protein
MNAHKSLPSRPLGNKERNSRAIAMIRCLKSGMKNLECVYPFAIHIHDRSGKLEWVLHEALKNCKSLLQLKGIVNIFLNS